MAERKSIRQRKPTVHFDEILAQSAKPAKYGKPQTKASKAREPYHDPTPTESSYNEAIQEDPVQLLCEQTLSLNLQANLTENTACKTVEEASGAESTNEAKAADETKAADKALDGLDSKSKKANKKAKEAKLACLKKLQFDKIVSMLPKPKNVVFEPFSPGQSRQPEVKLPPNIDASDLLALSAGGSWHSSCQTNIEYPTTKPELVRLRLLWCFSL
jgi:hypothetical protein